jgi:HD-GYP domain-containing protein (c-di-GMP phosphodiesterase class II)
MEKQMTVERISQIILDLNLINDLDSLLEKILTETRALTNADAGTIYLKEGGHLVFKHFQNNTLVEMDEKSFRTALYSNIKVPVDEKSLAGYCALNNEVVNIEDVYNMPQYVPYSFNNRFDEDTFYTTKSVLSVPLHDRHKNVAGVLQIINKTGFDLLPAPFESDDLSVVRFFAANASAAIEKARITRETILRMIKMAELRDPMETGSHVNRVGAYSVEIYHQWAKKNNIDENEIKKYKDNIRIAAMLHDVGKVAISDTILKKPGKLNEEEFAVIKTHPDEGTKIFENRFYEVDEMAAEISLSHHEKFDGTGYPKGIAGKNIPLSGRIVAIADVYDALVSKRVYKEAWPEEEVIREITSLSEKHFDPELVKCFVEIHDVIKAVRAKYPDK